LIRERDDDNNNLARTALPATTSTSSNIYVFLSIERKDNFNLSTCVSFASSFFWTTTTNGHCFDEKSHSFSDKMTDNLFSINNKVWIKNRFESRNGKYDHQNGSLLSAQKSSISDEAIDLLPPTMNNDITTRKTTPRVTLTYNDSNNSDRYNRLHHQIE
jgi:hypothetical protein